MFGENIGPHIAIDETYLSNGELYTIVTDRDRHGKEQCLIAIMAGTKAEDVCRILNQIEEEKQDEVKGGTLDLLNSMRKIVKLSFPKAKRVIDRFQRLKLANDAVQQIWIDHCWVALQEANGEQENAKIEAKAYQPIIFENGDTRNELLERCRYLLSFKSSEK